VPLYRAELIRRRKPLITRKLHDVSQVLYLPFDLDDGSYARDRSGYSNHGTIYGPGRVAGKINRALDFDGLDDYVEISESISLNPSQITLTAWVKPIAKAINEIMHKLSAGRAQYRLIVDTRDAAKELAFRKYDGTLFGAVVYKTGLEMYNVWSHVAGTFDGSVMRIYFNGVEVASKSETTPMPSAGTNLYIGVGQGMTYWFNGIIDEVHIYSRALSAAEIKRLMYLRGV